MTVTEMTPVVRGSDILLELPAGELDLAQTLDCGQAFRWSKQPDNDSYIGVARGRRLHLSRRDNQLVLHNTTVEDYYEIWQGYFDLGRNYAALKEQFVHDPVLRDALDYACGIRVLRQEPWETICTFIISANNNIPRIKGIVERLCQLCGEPLGQDCYTFPTPARMAELSESDLAPLRCGYRDKFLLDAAHKVAGGEVCLEDAAILPTDEARAALMKIKGVGPKVADCALLFGFGRSECFPMDTWMKKVMAVLYPQGLPEGLLSNAGIAQQYLFHYARHHGDLFV